MAAPPTQQPTREDLLHHLQVLIDRTETITAGAARRGISHNSMRKLVDLGQVQSVRLGRDVRVWRDE